LVSERSREEPWALGSHCVKKETLDIDCSPSRTPRHFADPIYPRGPPPAQEGEGAERTMLDDRAGRPMTHHGGSRDVPPHASGHTRLLKSGHCSITSTAFRAPVGKHLSEARSLQKFLNQFGAKGRVGGRAGRELVAKRRTGRQLTTARRPIRGVIISTADVWPCVWFPGPGLILHG
jgi:hypothetical protein